MIETIYSNPNELYHYGVKGMKWGVRKEIQQEVNRVSNVVKYGWKQGHGKNVYSRLNSLEKQATYDGTTRGSKMDSSQKQSLANAKKYWKNRAEGKGIKASGDRNIVKRIYDSSRSYNMTQRTARTAISALSSTKGRSIGQRAVMTMSSTAMNMGIDELINKSFGHF